MCLDSRPPWGAGTASLRRRELARELAVVPLAYPELRAALRQRRLTRFVAESIAHVSPAAAAWLEVRWAPGFVWNLRGTLPEQRKKHYYHIPWAFLEFGRTFKSFNCSSLALQSRRGASFARALRRLPYSVSEQLDSILSLDSHEELERC